MSNMKLSTMINTLPQAQAESQQLEQQGYDYLFTNESKHDPFLLSALAAERTASIKIMTYIAVAFARTPMLTAHSAHDLNALSKGRFTLGLGSQIKPHIERRYSMPWSHPAPRMKEYIQALHAIWDCWYDDKPLKFAGQFYNHTLTSPMFIPPDKEYGRPRVTLGAVGPHMTRVAAEVADGLLCHSFTTPRYLREVTLPTVERVLKENGRTRQQFQIVGMPFVAVGETDAALEKAVAGARKTISFYASTPAYKAVLDLHGLGDMQPEMLRLSKLGRWQDMSALVTEDLLNTFFVIGNANACARELIARYEGIFDLSCGYADTGPGLPVEVMQAIKFIQGSIHA
jgi:probable F420-dependent oxidoreductase